MIESYSNLWRKCTKAYLCSSEVWHLIATSFWCCCYFLNGWCIRLNSRIAISKLIILTAQILPSIEQIFSGGFVLVKVMYVLKLLLKLLKMNHVECHCIMWAIKNLFYKYKLVRDIYTYPIVHLDWRPIYRYFYFLVCQYTGTFT